MSGFENEVVYVPGMRLEPTSAQEIGIMQKTANDVSFVNISGSPEGVVSANPGSEAKDRTNGNMWIKKTGTGNTGWEQVATGADVPTTFTTDSGVATVASNNINLLAQNLAGSGVQTTGSGSTVTHRMLTPYTLGDFTFSTATAASTRTLTVTNSDNTSGSSNANLLISTGGASSGDPFTTYTVTGATSWSQGIDNSDSDAFVLSLSSVLGTSNVLRASAVTGNCVFSRNTVGGNAATTTANEDNTNSASNAVYIIQVAGTSAGDPYLNVGISGSQTYSLGLDNSDSDKLKITPGDFPSGGDVWVMTSSGERTMPLQPAFLAFLGTTDSNVTGDNTTVTLGAGNALTEVFDQGGDFVTTGTFTAPVTGRYCFSCGLTVTGGTAISTGLILMVTSNRTFRNDMMVQPALQTIFTYRQTVFTDMDANDTMTLTIATTDSGGKVDDLIGSATNMYNYMSGYLVC